VHIALPILSCVFAPTEKMETPIFSGLGQQLQRVLLALDINSFEAPVWTLKQNKDKIYLDICWFKTKFPAAPVDQSPTCSNAVRELEQTSLTTTTSCNDEVKQQDLDIDQEKSIPNVHPSLSNRPRPTLNKEKKKRKSPSTQKRDKQRLVKWLASKSTVPASASAPASAVVNIRECETSLPISPETETLPVTVIQPSVAAASGVNLDSVSSPKQSQVHHTQPKQAACEVCFKSDCLDLACIDQEIAIQNCHLSSFEVATVKQLLLQKLNSCHNPVCRIPASEVTGGLYLCTGCHAEKYCSRACQEAHWKEHKDNCAAPLNYRPRPMEQFSSS